jgi:hypothetical protein
MGAMRLARLAVTAGLRSRGVNYEIARSVKAFSENKGG